MVLQRGFDSLARFCDNEVTLIMERIMDNTYKPEYHNKLTDEEEVRLTERLGKIEIEQKIAWGLHRLSGGFVKAEYDECDEERIYITLTDGIQSDCCNRTNVTHCSLWRNTLEWTDQAG